MVADKDLSPLPGLPKCNILSGGLRPRIDIGRRSPAVPVTPPCVRVRTRRFGWFRPAAEPPISEAPENQSERSAAPVVRGSID
jgi:hypothetical protein